MWFWLRRVVRKYSNPIEMTTAEKWQFRLSLLYGFFAWNAGGYLIYLMYSARDDLPSLFDSKSKAEEDLRPPSERFASVLGIKKAHIIQMSGFKKTREYDIDNTLQEENTDVNIQTQD